MHANATGNRALVRRCLVCFTMLAAFSSTRAEAQVWTGFLLGAPGRREFTQFAVYCRGGRATVMVDGDANALGVELIPFSGTDGPGRPLVPTSRSSQETIFELEPCSAEYRTVISAESTSDFRLLVDGSGDVSVEEQPSSGISTGTRPSNRRKIYVPTTIYYATDRERAPPSSSSPRKADFTNRRSATGLLSRAAVTVNVEREETLAKPLTQAPAPPLVPAEDPLTARELGARLSRLPNNRNNQDVLVFVHGYRVPFSEALTVTASLARELDFDGAAVAYSWPSQVCLLCYLADLDHSRLSAITLEGFLEELTDIPTVRRVHIVAHSMKSDAVMEAIVRASLKKPGRARRLGHLLFFAADVAPDRFARILPALKAMSETVTLYASSDDWALSASKELRRGARRLGDATPTPVVIDGVITVDASGAAGGLSGHSYHMDARVLCDMRAVLRDDKAARERSRVSTIDGYYKLTNEALDPRPWLAHRCDR